MLRPAQATDLINETASLDKVRIGLNHVYNCDFDEAENTLVYLRKSYPSHPVTIIFRGTHLLLEVLPFNAGESWSPGV